MTRNEPSPAQRIDPRPEGPVEPLPDPSSDTYPELERRSRRLPRRRRGKILRFARSERLLHWSLAFPFLVCLSTAALLVFYYNPNPTRPYREVVSWIHRGAGVCFITLPLLVLLLSVRSWRLHWDNIKEGWWWTRADFKWLALMPLAVLTRRVRLPEEGKFNAGEKLNFMWTMASYPLYAVTGLTIWFGSSVNIVPWLAHIALAAVSVPLIAGHLFMAVINPSSRKGLSGMFTGFVDRTWAKHHYRRWFREKFGDIRAETSSVLISVRRPLARVLVVAVVLMLGVSGAAAYKLWPTRATSATAAETPRYLAGASPLWTDAVEGAATVEGGELARGEAVTLVGYAGEFALVSDERGREGYVFTADLLDAPPASEPGSSVER